MSSHQVTGAVPVMSASGVRYISEKLLNPKKDHKYFIVEYGSGASTKFFLEKLKERNIQATFITVERDPEWFQKLIQSLPNGELKKNIWSFAEYRRYMKAEPSNQWEIPEGCGRLKKTQRTMRSLRAILRLLFNRKNFWYDARYRVKMPPIQFECVYVYEAFKDQFGESVHKERYIQMPLQQLKESLENGEKCHLAVMVDGGPRADIVKEIFELEHRYANLIVDIFLLEAYRGYYLPVMSERKTGKFIAAEKNEMLNGEVYLSEPNDPERTSKCAQAIGQPRVAKALTEELWHYASARE